MSKRTLIAGMVTALLAATASGQQTNIDQRLEQLEQEIRDLKRQRELDREEAEQKAQESAKTTPLVKVGEEGFLLQSADGNFALRLRGTLQADGRFYLHDQPNDGSDTFLMRKVRPILEGTVFRDFDFRIMPDFGANQSLLQDAYVEWRSWSWLKVRAGKFKPPVGLEQLQQDQWVAFAERGLPSGLVPNRDVGLQISGDLFGGLVSYAGGVFNGVVDGGIADTDTGDSKDGAARIFLQPFKTTDINPLKGLGFGVAGTIGHPQFTSSSTNLPSYKSTGQLTFFSYRSGVTPDGTQVRGTPQAYYYWGPLGLLGEYVVSDQPLEIGTVHDHVRNKAWQVETTFVLTGENSSYNGVTPRRPFALKKRGWGAVEIVGRYGELEIDPNAFPAFADPANSAGEAREWGVGLNWYLNRNVKLVLDYEQTFFDGGATGGADRQTEQVVITRAQVAF